MPPIKKKSKKISEEELLEELKDDLDDDEDDDEDDDDDEEDDDDAEDSEEEEEEEEEPAPKKKSKKATPPPEEDDDEEEEEEKKPKLTKAQKRALFEDYEKAQAEQEKILATLEKNKGAASDCVKKIYDTLGSGPFLRNGKYMKIAVRGDLYFFRGVKGSVEEI